MATQIERLAIVETQVSNIEEKIDVLQEGVKDMHDCLDKTRDGIMTKLDNMYGDSCNQHAEMAGKIKELQKTKNKFTMYAMVVLAFAAGTGWIGNSPSFAPILKFLGL
jgi:tetrahydromethanopterin S-methyltransferase subunit B